MTNKYKTNILAEQCQCKLRVIRFIDGPHQDVATGNWTAIFKGLVLDDGPTLNTDQQVQVVASYAALQGRQLGLGQVWRCAGRLELHHGDWGSTQQLLVKKNCDMQHFPLSGENLKQWAITAVPFITSEVADVMWSTHGLQLLGVLENRDIAALCRIPGIGKTTANRLIEAYHHEEYMFVMSWLDSQQISAKIGNTALAAWGIDTRLKLRENPYRLASLGLSISDADRVAHRLHRDIADNDPRRLRALLHIAARKASRHGDTRFSEYQLRNSLRKVASAAQQALASHERANLLPVKELIEAAWALLPSVKSLMKFNGYYCARGTLLQELVVLARLHRMKRGEVECTSVDSHQLEMAIANYNDSLDYNLEAEQIDAIRKVVQSKVSIIVGGAGTGKTTVLKGVYHVLRALGQIAFVDDIKNRVPNSGVVWQLAVSGRAMKRMVHAAEIPALHTTSTTVFGFLLRTEDDLRANQKLVQQEFHEETGRKLEQIDISPLDIVVIDEASMLDLAATYRILQCMPPGARLLLVGDPIQLPPIGAGLVFHELVDAGFVPQRRLHVVKRQDITSGIPGVASAIRGAPAEGDQPECAPYWPANLVSEYRGVGRGVQLIACDDTAITTEVARVYAEMNKVGPVQILSAYRDNAGGCYPINQWLQPKGQQISYHHDGQEVSPPFQINDRIVFTENNHATKIYNGTLGTIVNFNPYYQAIDWQAQARKRLSKEAQQVLHRDSTNCLLAIQIDDGDDQRTVWLFHEEIYSRRNEPGIMWGWAISVHKSQGSQFERTIVAVPNRDGKALRFIDRSMIYTALTRAIEQVVFVGDPSTIAAACRTSAAFERRRTNIKALLERVDFDYLHERPLHI